MVNAVVIAVVCCCSQCLLLLLRPFFFAFLLLLMPLLLLPSLLRPFRRCPLFVVVPFSSLSVFSLSVFFSSSVFVVVVCCHCSQPHQGIPDKARLTMVYVDEVAIAKAGESSNSWNKRAEVIFVVRCFRCCVLMIMDCCHCSQPHQRSPDKARLTMVYVAEAAIA